ncbi:MAG TPA: helix-turn-helix domain-containing protein [Nitrolancea sp.]|nr:helix-turn-helix domain-containing protein [Nitrolancea sp.]
MRVVDEGKPELTVEERRRQALRPIFAYLDQWGIKRTWLAARLGVSRSLLWKYEHGWCSEPADFVDRACAALGRTREWLGLPAAAKASQRQKRAS